MSNVFGESDVAPTESKTTCTAGNFPHGSRETPAASAAPMAADRSEKARCHNSDAHAAGESHSPIVPEKPANNGGVPPPAESVEGRGLTKENTEQPLLVRIQRRNADGMPFVPRSRGLPGVRQAARKDRKLRFTNLLHHLTPQLLRASFFARRSKPRRELTARRGVTTRWISTGGSLICTGGSIAEHTGPSLPSGRTSPSLTAG